MRSFALGVLAASVGLGTILTFTAGARAEVVVTAGRSVSLMTLAAIDQVCHSQGSVTINVVVPPQGGFIEVMQVKAYPNFNALNTRSHCNTQKLPATQVIYQSSGTFLGEDYVTVEAIFPEGAARRIRILVSVRAVNPAEAALSGANAPNALAPNGEAVPDVPLVPVRPKPAHHARKPVATAQASRHRDAGRPAAPAHAHATPVAKTPLVNI